MKTVAKAVAAGSGFAVAGMIGFATWAWVDRQRAQRELDVHFENGKAYAARVLEEIGEVPDELTESSGLAVSRTQPGVLWSHNDSGDGPNLYAMRSLRTPARRHPCRQRRRC